MSVNIIKSKATLLSHSSWQHRIPSSAYILHESSSQSHASDFSISSWRIHKCASQCWCHRLVTVRWPDRGLVKNWCRACLVAAAQTLHALLLPYICQSPVLARSNWQREHAFIVLYIYIGGSTMYVNVHRVILRCITVGDPSRFSLWRILWYYYLFSYC